jgi:hypothetical protein
MTAAEGNGVGAGTQIGPYIVPGPVGLLVAVFTHGAIMSGVQSAQRKREQAEADRVLEPYAELLRNWSANELWNAAAASVSLPVWDGRAAVDGSRMIVVEPVFSMAPDEGALVLDAAIKLDATTAVVPEDATGVQMVRVVSTPIAAADARAHWSGDSGARLKTAATAMLSHALELAQRHSAASGADVPMRTHRYLQGTVERSERAQQLEQSCGRLALRNLRAWIMSVPTKAFAECASPAAF